MASRGIGKSFFLLYLLLLLVTSGSFRILVDCNSLTDEKEVEHESETDSSAALYVQVEKLEGLVQSLGELLSRVESKILQFPEFHSSDQKHTFEGSRLDRKKCDDGRAAKSDGNIEEKLREGERLRPVSVTKYSPFWSERFQFISAVKLDSDATCINLLPFRDYEGLSKYVAVGDERGRVYIFLRTGDVLVEFYTQSESPITTMLSYMSVSKNESFVVTGHINGVILTHRVWEASNGDDWSSLFMENVREFDSIGGGEDGSQITILELHHVGRMRYILSAGASGKITVYREDGTIYGSVLPVSKPIAFLKQRLLFMTETGAGSLDLRSMRIRESECEGLNHSLARNYVFDATERSKAYGFTSDGELIKILLLGDIMNFKCRVRSKRKVDIDEPLAFQAIKGYLIIASQDKVLVYNVSAQHYARVSVPRLVFSAGLDEIRSSFLNRQVVDLGTNRRTIIPLIGSDREKLVVLGLGGGYVGIYRSNLPVFKGEFNTMLWTSPVLFFILFLFGAWQFFAKKKEALTSWGPDDSFTSASGTVGDRPFADTSSRNADIGEMRGGGVGGSSGAGGGLRGPTRRYASPSRYTGGAGSSFRPSSVDPNSRTTSVDTNFRTASDLKFRGSNLETAGFSKRRESLFANSQVVDDDN